jgi:hypothetical protein
MFGPKSSNIGLQRLLAMRKAHIWRAFLIRRWKCSETHIAWLEWEDSNSRIPDRTRSLREFHRIWEYGGVFMDHS